jgi:hypothetical protein
MGTYEQERIRLLQNQLDRATAQIKERDHQDVLALAAAREAETKAKEAAQRAADQQARDAEIEATRKSAWFMWHTSPEQVERLAANSWSRVWIENNTPKEGWPPGDGPENYSYSAVAPPVQPEDDGVVPPLVLKARQMGLDV